MSTDTVQSNTTATNPPEMPNTQIAALDALLAGRSATEAAEAAGVARSTVYHWLSKDFRFQAALNRGRRELRQSVACRADQLASAAAECIVKAVQQGDVKAALEIVKRANIFTPSRIGSDDETVLRQEDEKQRVDREANLIMSRRCHKDQMSREARER